MKDDLLLSGMKLNSVLEEQWSFVEGKSMFSTQDLTVDNPLVKCPCFLE